MPRVAERLDKKAVAALVEPGKYAVGDPAGLTLVVLPAPTPGGRVVRKFVLRVRADGRSTDRTIGPFDPNGGGGALTLAGAREKAGKMKLEMAGGVDPLAVKRAAAAEAKAARQKSTAFREVAEQFIAASRGGWRAGGRTEKQWRLMFNQYVHPLIGDLPVGEVGVEHVDEILRGVWHEKGETGRRVRRRVAAVIDAAIARGLHAGPNPATVATVNKLLGRQTQAVRNHPAISVEDAPRLWAAVAATEGVSARALQFLLLTCTRSQEARKATWAEFDIDRAIWTIPADRTKTAKPFRIPLSSAALALLESIPGTREPDGLLFTTQSKGRGPNRRAVPLSDMAPAMVIRRLDAADRAAGGQGYRDRAQAGAPIVTPHGCARSTSRDWMASNGVSYEVAEACLAHVLPATARAYQRGDLLEQRREVLERWAQYLDGR